MNNNILSSIQTILKKNADVVNDFANRPDILTNKLLPIIKSNYVASVKADGLRCLLYYCDKGIYSLLHPFIVNKILDKSKVSDIYVLDCEYIEALNEYYIFDILIHKNADVTKRNLIERMKLITPDLLHNNIKIKEIYNLANNENIFKISKKIYNTKYPYGIDGIIYTPIYEPYANKMIYKWKPLREQTVDFLIREIKSVEKKGITIKTFSLFVSSNDKSIKRKLLSDKEYMKLFPFINNTHNYIPVYFTPAPTAEIAVTIHEIDGNTYGNTYGNNKNILIKDNTIVEFYYDTQHMRWIPHKYRSDKTAGYLDNFYKNTYHVIKGPNSWNTAKTTFEYIKHPIDDAILFGNKEMDHQYYLDIKKKGLKFNLYFYNNYIKKALYQKYLKKGDKVLDLAGGRGADIDKMLDSKYILHLDIADDVLKEAKRRYDNIKSKVQMDFLKFDLLGNDYDKIAQIKKMRNTALFDLVSCHFAFHYFCKSKQNIKYIVNLISSNLKKGGLFIMTGYDGSLIYNLLNKTPALEYVYKGNADNYKGTLFAKIIKKYNDRTLKECGQTINVYIEKIGIPQDEYLINFAYIHQVFKEHNMKPIEDKNFGFRMDKFDKYLTDIEKEYIKLHRYSIYEKYD